MESWKWTSVSGTTEILSRTKHRNSKIEWNSQTDDIVEDSNVNVDASRNGRIRRIDKLKNYFVDWKQESEKNWLRKSPGWKKQNPERAAKWEYEKLALKFSRTRTFEFVLLLSSRSSNEKLFEAAAVYCVFELRVIPQKNFDTCSMEMVQKTISSKWSWGSILS